MSQTEELSRREEQFLENVLENLRQRIGKIAQELEEGQTLQILTACGGRRKSSFSGRSVFLSPDLSGCRYHFRGAEK